MTVALLLGCDAVSDSPAAPPPGPGTDTPSASIAQSPSSTAPAQSLSVPSAETLISRAVESFRAGRHAEAISQLGVPDDSEPEAVRVTRIELANRAGFRQSANRWVRQLSRTNLIDRMHLVGLAHPNRPQVEFASRPDLDDRKQVDQFGLLSILYARQLRGEACGVLDAAIKHPSFIHDNPETLSVIAMVQSSCQADEDLVDLVARMPKSCRQFPAYWRALGNLAGSNSKLKITAAERLELFRMALRIEPNDRIACRAAIAAADQAGDTATLATLEKTESAIREIQSLVNEAARLPANLPTLVANLARTQNSSGRPLESIAWQLWYLDAAITMSPSSALRQSRNRVLEDRETVLERTNDGYQWDLIVGRFDPERAEQIADRMVEQCRSLANTSSSPLDRDPSVRSPLPSTPPSPVRFDDVTHAANVSFQWMNAETPIRRHFRLHEPLGGGVAIVDYDLDGASDLYLSQAVGDETIGNDQLLRGQIGNGGIKFHSVSDGAGIVESAYGFGVTAGDWNQDGWVDIAVANHGPNQLWINQGDGTFSPMLLDADSENVVSLSLAMADLSGNGLPELVEVNYTDDPKVFDPIRFTPEGSPINLPSPTGFVAGADRVWKSGPNGNPESALEWLPKRPGMGLVIANFRCNQGIQAYVSNDQMPNQFWAFSGAPFAAVDSAMVTGTAVGANSQPLAAMGIAASDFNHDDRLDLHVTNFVDEWANLFVQNSHGAFDDQSVSFGLADPSAPVVGFGCQAVDIDNDGDDDLIVANGHIEDLSERGVPFQMPTQCFQLNGRSFAEVTVDGAPEYWNTRHTGRGVAKGDLDHDGRMDLVITDALEPVRLFGNQTPTSGRFIEIELVATQAERSAVGSWLDVTTPTSRRRCWQQSGDGYLVRNEPILHTAVLGDERLCDLTVHWPMSPPRVGDESAPANPATSDDETGIVQIFRDVPLDSRVLIVQGHDEPWIRWQHEDQR